MLVTIKLRTTGCFRIVTVPDRDVLQANRSIEFVHRFSQAMLENNVVSGDVNVTGIDAGSNGYIVPQMMDDLRNLLKAAPYRILSAGSVFNQDCEPTLRQVKPVTRGGNGGSRLQQSFFAIGAAK